MLDSALKASAIVAIALVANRCLHSRSAALRHLVLSAAIVCAAAILPLTDMRRSLPLSLLGLGLLLLLKEAGAA